MIYKLDKVNDFPDQSVDLCSLSLFNVAVLLDLWKKKMRTSNTSVHSWRMKGRRQRPW
jgi:hypothetical protein